MKTSPKLTNLAVTHLDETDWNSFPPASNSVKSLRVLYCLAVPKGQQLDLNVYFSGLTSLVVAEGGYKLQGIFLCHSLQSLTHEISSRSFTARTLFRLGGATDLASEGYPWERMMAAAIPEPRTGFGPRLDELNFEIEHHFLFQEEESLVRTCHDHERGHCR